MQLRYWAHLINQESTLLSEFLLRGYLLSRVSPRWRALLSDTPCRRLVRRLVGTAPNIQSAYCMIYLPLTAADEGPSGDMGIQLMTEIPGVALVYKMTLYTCATMKSTSPFLYSLQRKLLVRISFSVNLTEIWPGNSRRTTSTLSSH